MLFYHKINRLSIGKREVLWIPDNITSIFELHHREMNKKQTVTTPDIGCRHCLLVRATGLEPARRGH